MNARAIRRIPREIHAPVASDVDLTQLLAARRWIGCTDPFPHVRADEVFKPGIYRELAAAFNAILCGHGLASWPDARFTRNMPGYDASAVDFDERMGWPFSLFASRAWHDLFARLFAIDAARCVSGALHHHAAGSSAGFVHNDLNPGWFIDSGADIVLPRIDACNYRTGETFGTTALPRETVRGVAILFYLNNPGWRPDDGGETGLFRSSGARHPVVAVPPTDNSLIAFECSPTSFHAFHTNHRRPRNSVIAWVHQEKASVVARWGESAIVRWR